MVALEVVADGDLDGLVGGAEGVCVVDEVLAVVDDVLAGELHGQEAALVAVGLGLQGREDVRLRDVGVHGEVVEAREEHHVVYVGGADGLAEEVGREGGVALLRGLVKCS